MLDPDPPRAGQRAEHRQADLPPLFEAFYAGATGAARPAGMSTRRERDEPGCRSRGLAAEGARAAQRFAPLPAELAPRTPTEAYAIQEAFVALRARERGARRRLQDRALQRRDAALRRRRLAAGRHDVRVHPPPFAGAHPRRRLRQSDRRVRDRGASWPRTCRRPTRRSPRARGAARSARSCRRSRLPMTAAPTTRELAQHPLDLIADNTWNEGAVLGRPVANWRDSILPRCVASPASTAPRSARAWVPKPWAIRSTRWPGSPTTLPRAATGCCAGTSS